MSGLAGRTNIRSACVFHAIARRHGSLAEVNGALPVDLLEQVAIESGVPRNQVVQRPSAEQGDGSAALEVAVDDEDPLLEQVAKSFGYRDGDGGLACAALEIDRGCHTLRQFDCGHASHPRGACFRASQPTGKTSTNAAETSETWMNAGLRMNAVHLGAPNDALQLSSHAGPSEPSTQGRNHAGQTARPMHHLQGAQHLRRESPISCTRSQYSGQRTADIRQQQTCS